MTVRKDSESEALETETETETETISAYAAQVLALIEEGQLVQARAMVQEALEQHPQDPELLSLREVLSPPRGRPRSIIDADRSEEFEWITTNRDSYRGRWVAVDGNSLVAEAHSFAELQSRLRNLAGTPLVHRID